MIVGQRYGFDKRKECLDPIEKTVEVIGESMFDKGRGI